MKKAILTFITIVAFTNVTFSQEYEEHLTTINSFLRTFDSGYYGPLSVDNDYIYCNIKGGKQSKILISEISKANVVTENKKVQIFCKNEDCVTGVTGAKYKTMSFSTNDSGFNTTEFAFLLNLLIDSLRE